MNLGIKIKQLRTDRGITQAQLSKLIYKSKRTVEKYENNEIDISISTLADIAKVLDVTLISFLVEDPTDILSIVKDYYNLEDKPLHSIEQDFEMVMKGFIERYKK